MSSMGSSLRSLESPLNRDERVVTITEPSHPEREPLQTFISPKMVVQIAAAILAIGAQLAANYLVECDPIWRKKVQLVQSASLLALAALALCHSQTEAERTIVQVHIEDPFVSFAPAKKVTRRFTVEDMTLPFPSLPEFLPPTKVYIAVGVTTLFAIGAPVLQLTLFKNSNCGDENVLNFILPCFAISAGCVCAVAKVLHEREISERRAIELAHLRDIMADVNGWNIGQHVTGSLNELWDRIKRMPSGAQDETYLKLFRLLANAQISRWISMPHQTNVRKNTEEKS